MKAKRITKQDLALEASQRWDKQYSDNGYWAKDKQKQDIGRKLRALKDPTPKKIEAIIGNPSWTALECEICNKDQETAVALHGEYRDITICDRCLTKGLKAK